MKTVICTMGGSEQGWSRHNAEGIFRDYAAESKRLYESATRLGYKCIVFNNEFIDELGYRKSHDNILGRVSFGFAYKAICLWSAIRSVEYGDFIFYLDSNHIIKGDLFDINKWAIQHDLFLCSHDIEPSRENIFANKLWTRRSTFINMGCDSDEYWNRPQIHANTIGVYKTDRSLKILREFLSFSLNESIMFGLGDCENFEGFQQHRFDQSLLTNLAVKFDLPIYNCYMNKQLDDVVFEAEFIKTQRVVDEKTRENDSRLIF